MFAAVDLGSNSFRLHIGHHDGDTIRVVKSARDPIRLGAGLDAQMRLTPQAMRVAVESLARFRELLAGYDLDAVRVVATNTLRIAQNAAEFLPQAEEAIGYPVEIISGEEEGRLIYFGVACTMGTPDQRRLVLDIGGGSTEMVVGQGQDIRLVESFSTGSVAHSNAFFADGRIDAAIFDAAIVSARGYFEDAAPMYRNQTWDAAYGTSGTIRAIADAMAKNGIGDGSIRLDNLEALKKRLIRFGHAGKIQLAGLKPERAAVIAGGVAVLIGVMQEAGIAQLAPVEAGLRLGVLWDLHLRAIRRDRRDVSVRNFMQRMGVDTPRGQGTADIASSLFARMKPGSDALARLLYWSGLLHEVGQAVSHSGYHKHGAYMVENADLSGFTRREQRIVSQLVLAQKGNLRKLERGIADADFMRATLALRLAVIFMHGRSVGPLHQVGLRMKNRIELDLPRAWLAEHPTLSFWLAREREYWKEIGNELQVRYSD
ncbi:Ppx/GppA phosphatase family protein [Noviherbaspirillum pedocola]|uniref:Ppx/GppA family phosphatase n=1 Tax=Noviherbaspirillum pedocola TaxID=2801341 RepID=A0A934W6X4_9BURK|nr:Ppx/GppA phosphatase family protein [Noviherbaspirillum pedocola]MBK4734034.1 Ppx/GppA family phosphatase [Noviherbaspirillum pedocola]